MGKTVSQDYILTIYFNSAVQSDNNGSNDAKNIFQAGSAVLQ